jgi:hypothetical protein
MDGHTVFIKIGVVELKVSLSGYFVYLPCTFARRDKNHPIAIKGGRKFKCRAVDAVAVFDRDRVLGQKVAATKKRTKD